MSAEGTGSSSALAVHILFKTNLAFPLNSSLCLKTTDAGGGWMEWRATSANDRQRFNQELVIRKVACCLLCSPLESVPLYSLPRMESAFFLVWLSVVF